MKTSASIPSLQSRRTFLRGMASGSLLALSPQWLRSQNTANRGAILYVTDAVEKHAARLPCAGPRHLPECPEPPSRWIARASTRPILGFGAALTDAACYLLNGMPATARNAFLTEMYSPVGLNLNVGRCCIGASDYSRNVYSYDDGDEDMKLDRFSLKHDEACILPALREIRRSIPASFWWPARGVRRAG